MPTVNKGESESDFVSRCVGDKGMVKEFRDQKRRVAVCYSIYKQSKKKKAKGSDNTLEGLDIFVID
jgi:hypothetical protein